MARYIDADELKKLSIKFGEEQGKQRFSELLCEYIDCIPTADVVPKSEVEWLYKQVDCLSQEVMYNDDIAKMKVDEAKAEVAREIFEEIEDALLNNHCLDEWSDYPTPHYYEELKDDIAELKKKYTEGEE